ncbi:hypothetical protein BV20DRAFT_1045304 [Pilatotrama ljubarskyi]|nr:hypothetical protein BV20DRAFT_1045304 [Pilatotrama ljubarskyi]
MSAAPKIGLLVPLHAKHDQVDAVAQFLNVGYSLTTGNQEPETLQWFAVKYEDQPVFAIFDTFAAESGRKAHIDGKVADALRANASTLLARGPDITGGHIDILASKVKHTGPEDDVKKGLTCGLRVLLKAKPHKVDDVRAFLKSAVPLVDAEQETPLWYAIEFSGSNVFGIIDFFKTPNGLDAHLKGEVAKALFSKVDELLEAPPDVVKTEVLGATLQ